MATQKIKNKGKLRISLTIVRDILKQSFCSHKFISMGDHDFCPKCTKVRSLENCKLEKLSKETQKFIEYSGYVKMKRKACHCCGVPKELLKGKQESQIKLEPWNIIRH